MIHSRTRRHNFADGTRGTSHIALYSECASVAGLGSGGEGYLSFSIATPTGEGDHAADVLPAKTFDNRRVDAGDLVKIK